MMVSVRPARTITLPAGDYRLYLIADGGPVTIRLRLNGLKGVTAVTPTVPATVDIESLKRSPGFLAITTRKDRRTASTAAV